MEETISISGGDHHRDSAMQMACRNVYFGLSRQTRLRIVAAVRGGWNLSNDLHRRTFTGISAAARKEFAHINL